MTATFPTGLRWRPLICLAGALAALACSSPRSRLPASLLPADDSAVAQPPNDAAPPAPPDAFPAPPRDAAAPEQAGPASDAAPPPPRAPDTAPDLAPPDPCQPVCRPELVAHLPGDNTLLPATAYTQLSDELFYIDRTRGEIMATHITRATTRTTAPLDMQDAHALRLAGSTVKWLANRPDGTQDILSTGPGAGRASLNFKIPAAQKASDFVSEPPIWVSELGMASPTTRRYAIRTTTMTGAVRTLYDAAVDVASNGLLLGYVEFQPALFFVNGPPGMVEVHRGDDTGGASRSLRRTSASVQLLGLVGDLLYWIEDEQQLWRAPASGAAPATLVTMAPRGRYRFGVYAGGRFYLFGDKQLAAVLHQDQVRLLVAPQPSGERAALGIDASHVIWLDDKGALWRAKL